MAGCLTFDKFNFLSNESLYNEVYISQALKVSLVLVPVDRPTGYVSAQCLNMEKQRI